VTRPYGDRHVKFFSVKLQHDDRIRHAAIVAEIKGVDRAGKDASTRRVGCPPATLRKVFFRYAILYHDSHRFLCLARFRRTPCDLIHGNRNLTLPGRKRNGAVVTQMSRLRPGPVPSNVTAPSASANQSRPPVVESILKRMIYPQPAPTFLNTGPPAKVKQQFQSWVDC
jgi:hypothetical protein